MYQALVVLKSWNRFCRRLTEIRQEIDSFPDGPDPCYFALEWLPAKLVAVVCKYSTNDRMEEYDNTIQTTSPRAMKRTLRTRWEVGIDD